MHINTGMIAYAYAGEGMLCRSLLLSSPVIFNSLFFGALHLFAVKVDLIKVHDDNIL